MAILSAGINFGKPQTEFIVESDESGVIQSCRNVVTGVEYADGGGGGGGGDLTTAEMTIIGHEGLTYFDIPVFANVTANAIDCGAEIYEQEENSKTYTVALYKGKMTFYLPGGITITAHSGDVEESGSIVTVTGNCSITLRVE